MVRKRVWMGVAIGLGCLLLASDALAEVSTDLRAVPPPRRPMSFLDVITDHVSISRGVIRVMAERLRRRHEEQGLVGGPDDLEIG